MPVNEAAGTPSISLPLYEVHSGSLTLPLTLSYHASGIRVGDQASWVGLGWALNGGGVITRQVRGMPDERSRGFAENYRTVPKRDTVVLTQDEGLLYDITNSRADYQPDLYNFNMMGQAGSFMLGNDGSFHCLPLQPVRIQQRAGDFLLTDKIGNTYFFAHQEKSRSTGRPPATIEYISAWYLSRIVSADKADTIRLEYEAYSTSALSVQQQHSIGYLTGQSGGGNLDTPIQNTYSEVQTTTTQNTWRLRRIVFQAGEVRFRAAARQDIRSDQRLAALTVLAEGSDTLKYIQLFHSYYNGDARLRLDSLATTAPKSALPPYRFTYDTTPLPNRLSGSRDHWGYANGAASVSSLRATSPFALLIPRMPVTDSYGPRLYAGADRSPNPRYVQTGILTAITYPTGGSQHFTYEPNTVPALAALPTTALPTHWLATTGPGQTAHPNGNCQEMSDTLTITQSDTRLYYRLTGTRYRPTDDRHDLIYLDVYNLASPLQALGGKRFFYRDSTDESYQALRDSLSLSVGKYRVVIHSCGNTTAQATLTPVYAPTGQAWRNTLAGGVRLRTQRIQASPQAPATIKRYRYNTPGSSLSSGYTVGKEPLYLRTHVSRIRGKSTCGDCVAGPPAPSFDITYQTLSSSSLTETMGSDRPVGYRYVTVLDSLENMESGRPAGYVVSQYGGSPDEGGSWKPACPLISNAWLRDQLLEQCTYATRSDGTAQLLVRIQQEYAQRDSVEFTSFVASTDADIQYDRSGPSLLMTQDGTLVKYIYENARQTSGWQYLRQTRRYQYAPTDTSAYQLTTTTYRYDNPAHQQPTLTETLTTGGQRQQVRARYVADFDSTQVTRTSPAAAQALRELARLHAPAQLVEQTTTRTTPTDTLVTQSQLTLSRVLAPGVVVPDRQLVLRAGVLPWQGFGPSRLQAGRLRYDAHYEPRLFFDRYSADRQPTQTHLAGGLPTSYLWDTRTGQPLAQANAALTQLAATSFEPGAAGRWTYDTYLGVGQHLRAHAGRTGSWAYQLNSGGPIRCDSLPAGTYELTCWYQGSQAPRLLGAAGTSLGVFVPMGPTSGGWQAARVRWQLAAASSVQVSAPADNVALLLDDLRLCPVGTQLTTYTYDALRGVTSQTGPDGRTTFYEYDGLGRLIRTRDEQGRILSQQQYHYAGK
jgi:YD repeat-containing protein